MQLLCQYYYPYLYFLIITSHIDEEVTIVNSILMFHTITGVFIATQSLSYTLLVFLVFLQRDESKQLLQHHPLNANEASAAAQEEKVNC